MFSILVKNSFKLFQLAKSRSLLLHPVLPDFIIPDRPTGTGGGGQAGFVFF
ncbi:hypothetical protein MNBD_BACTEROID03-2457 [hydrothermal vent metagenome]|uniref:Uncharacterized protein n=1 Tax=hydrothermal vent metagenome TaxID=652676 RepID=A0A3B0T7E3_9ZZZZ